MKIKCDEKGYIDEVWYDCEISIDSQQYYTPRLDRKWTTTPGKLVKSSANKQINDIFEDGLAKSIFTLNGISYDADEQLIKCRFSKSSRCITDLHTEDVRIRTVHEEDEFFIDTVYLYDNKIPAILLKDLNETGTIDINTIGMIRTYTKREGWFDMPCILHLHCTAYQLAFADDMKSFEEVYSIVTSLEPVEEVKEE